MVVVVGVGELWILSGTIHFNRVNPFSQRIVRNGGSVDKNKKNQLKLLGDPLHKCRNYRKDILRVKSSSSIEMIMGSRPLTLTGNALKRDVQ